ncbi:zinc finger and BTB domain-containing protein 16-A [Trachinotus anak]|uniref:zinc finger and BTB domain-containing protein 16-A n=1 Tax=Trachinotus anak TaxID=443729 RepID=UPI0039F1AA78
MIRLNNTKYFHFLQQADALRRSGSLCDAIISVKSHTFRAHRLVLACASRRLAQQLAQGDIDSPAHCTLEYFSPHTFQQVLDFTYTQALEVSVEDLYLLLRAAQLLEMESLEDQCRKQLDTLNSGAREEDKRGGKADVKEEKESTKEMDQKKKGPVLEEKLQEASLMGEETCNSVVMENLSPPDSAKHRSSSPRKKPRLSPLSSKPYNRDSVIAGPATSSSPFSSSWTFPTNMWNSVSTLRRIAENCSNLIAAHPRHSTNQSSVAYPFSLSTTPHMFPLLGPHFQNPVHNSVMSYSGFYPHYTQNLYAGSAGMGGIIKQGLLKRKKPSQRAFSETAQSVEQSYPQAPKASTEKVKDCQHCKISLLGDPVLRESASTPSGEACAGCRFCGRRDVGQHEPQSNRQDHRGDKPYQCQHCPKKFSLKHQLDTHHRVHTGEKPFECRLCGQRSRDYSAMIKHLRTHGGAAPYQCTVCMEFCSSLVAMQRHVKSHAVQDFPPDWSINSTYLYTSHI